MPRTLFHGSAGTGSYEFPQGLQLIHDETAFAETWTRLQGHISPLPQRPAADFTREAVLILAIGTRPQTGYSVTIDQVTPGDGGLTVDATEIRNTGFGGQMEVAPVHVVAVDAALSGELRLNLRVIDSDG